MSKSNTTRSGWNLSPTFSITLHLRDLPLLIKIKTFFGEVGHINVNKTNVHYKVRSREELLIIITHFKSFPLQTSKLLNFKIFMKIYDEIGLKTHLTSEGFLSLAALINQLNRPLKADLSTLGTLPEITIKETIDTNPNLNLWWITGFTDGEGCFTYFKRKRLNSKNELKEDITPIMEISQLTKDSFILKIIGDLLNLKRIYHEKRGISKLRSARLEEINQKVIPHFENYPLQGYKKIQYEKWLDFVKLKIESKK